MKWRQRRIQLQNVIVGGIVVCLLMSLILNWKLSSLTSSPMIQNNPNLSTTTTTPRIYPISWHTNFYDIDDDTTESTKLRDGSIIDHCLEQANQKHIKPYEQLWFDQKKPQLASVVLAPPMFNNMTHYWHVIFNTMDMQTTQGVAGIRKMKRHEWMRKGLWFCDGQPAVPLGKGCPNGETLVIRCPQLGHEATPYEISVKNQTTATYYIGDHINCFKNHTFAKPPVSGGGAIAANALLFGDTIKYPRRLIEWVEYHRMIGVDHFFIYYMGSYAPEEEFFMPNLPYLTYIPYDLMTFSNSSDDVRGAFRFQVPQQMDAILRARGLGYRWILMHDMDEYVQFGDPTETFKNMTNRFEYNEHGNFTKIGGISLQSTTYGTAHGEPRFPELMIDYTWKRRGFFVGERQKAIVKPMNLNYFAVHGVTLGAPVHDVDPSLMRLAHYRHPELGVSLCKKPAEDTSLRDLWHDKLKARVDVIWGLMKNKYDLPDEIWNTDHAFRNYHENTKTGHHSTV